MWPQLLFTATPMQMITKCTAPSMDEDSISSQDLNCAGSPRHFDCCCAVGPPIQPGPRLQGSRTTMLNPSQTSRWIRHEGATPCRPLPFVPRTRLDHNNHFPPGLPQHSVVHRLPDQHNRNQERHADKCYNASRIWVSLTSTLPKHEPDSSI
jgi:hypothetical protein